MKIVTSLSFRGQCREAFEFYARVLGGEITAAMPYGEAPPDMPVCDPKHRDWLMHCWLEAGDQALMGADMDVDWAPGVDKPKNGFDVTLHTEDADQARRWYDALLEGGKAVMPFAATFWSPGFGALIDKFGVPWIVNTIPTPDEASGVSIDAAISEQLRRLNIVREFEAPRALVWKMWTDPAHVAAWWAPEHFTTPEVRMDVRPGGAIHMVMRAPDGADYPFDGRFVFVDEPELLVMRTWVNYADGATWFEVEQTVRFEEVDGRTIQEFSAKVLTARADALGPLSGMKAGWTGSLDKLAAHIRAVTATGS